MLDPLHRHLGGEALPAAGRMAAHGHCRPGLAASLATRRCARRPWSWAGRFHLPAGARHYFVCCGCCASFLYRQRLGPRYDEELTPIEDDDAPFVEEGDRSSVSLGWVYHALHEREGPARLADVHGLSLAGRERTAAPHRLVRTAGAQSRRPHGAVDRARSRRRFRTREKKTRKGRGSAVARAPRKKAAPKAGPPPEKFELPSVRC